MGPEEQAWVDWTKDAIEKLNRRHPGRFCFFFRQPQYQDDHYLGWERKRGALLELARFLRSVPSGLGCWRENGAHSTAYVIFLTLDSDTALNVDAARQMIRAMLHPMNQPKIDLKRRLSPQAMAFCSPGPLSA